MTITINGTTGIAGVDGSASTPAVQGTDTNTGIFFPAADTIAFGEGGAEVARFDSSGNLGLGTTSVTQFGSAYKMVEIVGTDGGAIRLRGSSDSLASQDAIIYKVAGSEGALWVRNYANGIIGFMTNNTERARITSGGNFFVGCTTAPSASVFGIQLSPVLTSDFSKSSANSTGDIRHWGFYNTNGLVGGINTNGSATSFNTSSDYRLKENIAPMTGALSTVTQLNPVTYTWKADGSTGQGFIAHELQEVVPDCVTGEKDAVDADGNPVYQGVDTSFLVATLTAAIQELKAELDTTKARLAALEAN